MPAVLRNAQEIEAIAAAGRVAHAALEATQEALKPGISCLELSAIAEQVIRSHGAEPTFVGYHGFPSAICACPNSVVAHGIPDGYVLDKGDLIGIDVAATLDGWIADTAATFAVGEITAGAQRLLAATEEARQAAIEAAVPGANIGAISLAIEEVAVRHGLGVVRDLAGHAVGRELHEGDVIVPNIYDGERELLREGMVLALEPMFNLGSGRVLLDSDGWSVISADGSLSACFEHTVAVTSAGARILTL